MIKRPIDVAVKTWWLFGQALVQKLTAFVSQQLTAVGVARLPAEKLLSSSLRGATVGFLRLEICFSHFGNNSNTSATNQNSKITEKIGQK